MIQILYNIRPRFEKKGEIILKILEDVEEVIYLAKGNIDVGFEVNDTQKYIIRLEKGDSIGGYYCLFNV